jgi:hypothetical protein
MKCMGERENSLPNPGDSRDPWTGQELGEISSKRRVSGMRQREIASNDVQSSGLFERCIKGRPGQLGYVPGGEDPGEKLLPTNLSRAKI